MDLDTLRLPLEVADSAFKAGIAGAIGGVTALVGAMTVAVKSTFKWADELDQIGDVMDVTTDHAAALNFVVRKSGGDTETMTKAFVILEKGLVTARGQLDTTGKALQSWGIKVKDTNGKLKDQTTLINDIAKKYSSFSTQQERVNFLTEIFGKSGASMIDFFDTLAQEGGIDAVTEKVKGLGLAIDPGRYEQFNRNLEEMKMVGLGLAVQFTEKLMPTFEAISKWASEKGIPALKSFGDELGGAFKKGGVAGVGNFLLDQFDKINWADVSTKITEGINSIDWSQAGMDFAGLVSHMSTSIWTAVTTFDWLGLGNSLASALNNFIAGMFGTNEAGAQVAVQNWIANIRTQFTNWVSGAPSDLDGLDAAINAKIVTPVQNMVGAIGAKLAEAKNSFVSWVTSVPGTLANLGANLLSAITGAMTSLATNIEERLRTIAKIFFDRALGWTQQAKAGFSSGLGGLLNMVETIVGKINSILSKIITDFVINIKTNIFGGGGSSTPSTSSTGSSGSTGGSSKKRASGGAFMIPSSYGYEGFNAGALGTISGGEAIRITPRGQADTINLSDDTINKLAERLGLIIPTATVKAMNNV